MTHPIWTLYARRFGQRLGYWLSALGLNWRDQSTSNRLYMVYFFAFWAVWAVAVFALLGGWIAAILGLFPAGTPPQIALGLAEISLVGWTLYSLWRASRRSPFVFSEEDAHLVCQTPVSRAGVALALFLLNWYEAAFPFAFGTIAICFGVVQARHTGAFAPEQLLDYLTYSLRGLSLIIPLHLGLQALAWAVGALRLRGRTDYPWLRWSAPAVGAVLVLTPLALPSQALPALRLLQQPWLWPLNAELGAGFVPSGAWGPWGLAALLALVFAAASVAALVAAAQRLSFSRAAQETTMQAMLQGARRFGRPDLAQALALRQRLGAGRPPSEWLARPGSWVMLSKAAIQTARGLTLGQIVTWLYIAGLGAGVLTAPNIFVKLLVGALWVLAVSNATTARLRSDLANWALLRLLPLPAQRLFLAELALPWAVTVLLGEAAMSLVPSLALSYRLVVGAGLPFLVGSVALAAGADVLRQARVRTLMVPALTTENVPQPGLWGLLQGLASVALVLGVLEWSLQQPGWALWVPLALGLAFVTLEINLGSVLSAYRWMH
jgi:hypothetical protein